MIPAVIQQLMQIAALLLTTEVAVKGDLSFASGASTFVRTPPARLAGMKRYY